MFDRRQNLGLGEIEEKEEGGIRGSGCVLMHTILTLFLSDFTTVELSNNRSKLTMGWTLKGLSSSDSQRSTPFFFRWSSCFNYFNRILRDTRISVRTIRLFERPLLKVCIPNRKGNFINVVYPFFQELFYTKGKGLKVNRVERPTTRESNRPDTSSPQKLCVKSLPINVIRIRSLIVFITTGSFRIQVVRFNQLRWVVNKFINNWYRFTRTR